MTGPPRPPDRRPPSGPPPAEVRSAGPGPPGPSPAGRTGVDWRLATRGGLNGLVFVAPAAVVGQLLADGDGRVGGAAALAIVGVQLLGFCFAGWVVRRLEPRSPAATCASAGLVCWAVLQSAGIVTSLVRGQELNPLTWAATALLATVTALLGGLLARVERRSPHPTTPREDTP